MMLARRQPLVVVASATSGAAERIAARFRRDGALAYATHSAQGCLRVATSVRPDVVLIDPALQARGWLMRLLRAHPSSAHAALRPITSQASEAAGVERTAHLVAA